MNYYRISSRLFVFLHGLNRSMGTSTHFPINNVSVYGLFSDLFDTKISATIVLLFLTKILKYIKFEQLT